jgi:hypothetical protein
MKINLQLTALAISFTMAFNAQNAVFPGGNPVKKQRCGTEAPSQEWNDAFNKKVEEYKQNLASGKITATNYTISVIFHIVAGAEAVGTYPNLSQAQIGSQIAVMNADFAGTGMSVGSLAATAFSAVGAANCNISFCLAKKNVAGQTLPEPGIDRINYIAKGWADPASFGTTNAFRTFIDGTVKAQTIWDVTSYLNIWVTNCGPGVNLLGYATFPIQSGLSGIPANSTGGNMNDGVWLASLCTGSINNGSYYGRTASHEVGHYLGLRHIGGDAAPNGDCNATDYCNDTPPQLANPGDNGQNYGSPSYPLNATGPLSCPAAPNGAMFMNFMDYTDDIKVCMFTPDQRTRIQTAMANGFYRTGLSPASATLCNNPPSTPVAINSMPSQVCDTIATITTTNNSSTGNPIPTFSWSSSPAAGVTFSPNSTSNNPNITFPSAGLYTISCVASNSVGTNTATNVVTVTGCALNSGIRGNSIFKSYISLQPNPSSGKISLITNLPVSQTLDISIHSVLGQAVLSSRYRGVTNNVFEFDLSTYSNGVYFVTIDNGNEKTVKRLILNK